MKPSRYPLLVLMAAVMAACSVEVDDKPAVVPPPRQNSPQSQVLLVGAHGDPNLPSNTVKYYDIATDEVVFNFRYSSTEDAYLHYAAQTLGGTSCPGDPHVLFSLIPIGIVPVEAEGEPERESRSKFQVQAGLDYDFQVRVMDVKGCSSIFIEFTMGQEAIPDTYLGSETLNTSGYNELVTKLSF